MNTEVISRIASRATLARHIYQTFSSSEGFIADISIRATPLSQISLLNTPLEA
jgi:hypothetical protein